MLVKSVSLDSPHDDVPDGTPLFGWQNLITVSSITADTEEIGYPATNMANPATHLTWKAEAGSPQADPIYITMQTGTADDVDYIAIANHNLGSAGITVTIEGTDGNSPAVWSELVQETTLDDDGPAVFQFNPQQLGAVRIKLGTAAGIEPARIAVVYLGKLLICERGLRINTDFTAISLGRKVDVVNGRSESGNFLGRIIVGEQSESTIGFAHFDPDWYLANFDPFLDQAAELPFFIVVDPDVRPEDCGYCWLADDPEPAINPITRRVAVELVMRGLA